MPAARRVSILVLGCNKVRFTTSCLDALLTTDYPDVELWLIDNGSRDSTPELFDQTEATLADRDGWQVRRLTFPENVGAVEGRNAALQCVTGAYVAFMDNDIVVPDGAWLRKMITRLEADDALGILGPKLVFPQPENMLQCAGCVVTPMGRVDFRGRGLDAHDPEWNNERDVQCLISACWIMRRELIDEIGLLDMAYHPVQFEDIDYCYRAREAGWRVLYFPDVFLYHYENVTTDGTGALNYRYLTVKNGLVFKRRWRHMFSTEDGPPDESIEWRELPRVSWDEVE